jgi:hypothetical protein
MTETPHSALLDRSESKALANTRLAPQLELISDLANYGSNLVIRAFESSPKKLPDVIVCGVLLKQLVAMVDAVHVLLAAGHGHAAFLPARAGWEASIYLDWILFSDSERKAAWYLVGNYRDERTWVHRITPGTLEEATFARITKSVGVDVHANRPDLAAQAEAHLTEVNRVLAQPEFATIDAAFTKLRGKKKTDPEWYELGGVKSVRQIAEAVGRIAEYEAFYAKGSQVTHTGTYKDHVRFKDEKVHFKTVRHLESFNVLLNFVVSMAVGTYKRVLQMYRPGEIPAFQKKYVDDWRAPFQGAPAVVIND